MNNTAIFGLVNHLQAPFIVKDILAGCSRTDEDLFALSEVIGDMNPDEALLAIALSVRSIVTPYLQASPMIGVLKMQCDRVFDDYAASLHAQSLADMTDNSAAYSLLSAIKDDITYMNDLLDFAVDYLQHKDHLAYDLCRIIQAQCRSQSLICETLCAQYEKQDVVSTYQQLERRSVMSDNVISVSFESAVM